MSTIKKLKRGDVHPETGKIFWEYAVAHANGERWITPVAYEAYRQKRSSYLAGYYSRNRAQAMATSSRTYRARRAGVQPSRKVSVVLNTCGFEKARIALRRKTNSRRKRGNISAISHRLRARTRAAFRFMGWRKTSKTQALLGCDWQTLKAHLEEKFHDGMSWANKCLWHIDHIIPLASAKTPEELSALCHFSNLQPLWASDNIRKSNRT